MDKTVVVTQIKRGYRMRKIPKQAMQVGVKLGLKKITGQGASAEEYNHLKRASDNQRLTGIVGRKIKSPRGLESFPRIILLSRNI